MLKTKAAKTILITLVCCKYVYSTCVFCCLFSVTLPISVNLRYKIDVYVQNCSQNGQQQQQNGLINKQIIFIEFTKTILSINSDGISEHRPDHVKLTLQNSNDVEIYFKITYCVMAYNAAI